MKNMTKLTFLLVIFVLGTACKSQPAASPSSENIRDIYAGVANVFIVKEDNTLWAVGYNRSDQLGLGDSADASGDPRIARINDDTGAPFSGVKAVASGENHTVILKDDGTLWGAGDSSCGELGLDSGRLKVFTQLQAGAAPIAGVKTVAAGNNNTFFINSDGDLWASGYNYYGELGLGNRDTQLSFVKVESAGSNVKALSAGIRHTVLVKEDGTLWAAGYNFNGQLGLGVNAQGDTEDRYSFTEVKEAGSDISAVAAGSYHTVILKNDGTVWTAGSNYWGQLGFAGKNDRHSFTKVSDENGNPLTGVQAIAARGNITVLLKADGSLLLAGNYADSEGRIELPSESAPPESPAAGESDGNSAKSSFVSLVPDKDASVKFGAVKKIILGYNSIYVVDSDGRLWAAGSNRYGQLSLDPATEILSTLKLIN